jgi:hypothetical protein
VKSILSRLRRRASFANVTSVMALFVALGGTSYAAITLPANSVGKSQIRSSAVGQSEVASNSIGPGEIRTNAVRASELATNSVGWWEIKPNAIDTDELADGGIQAADLSAAAKAAINGVTYKSAVTGAGAAAGGNAKSITRTGTGEYTVELATDVGACQYGVTLAGTKSGTTITPPAVGFATATQSTEATKVLVKTYDQSGTLADSAFHLLVAC